MSLTLAYSPRRDLASKIKRRLIQFQHARPAVLRFEAPIVSVCFDDFPHSAAANAAPILARHGGRGTYYASASLAGKAGPCGDGFTPDDVQRLENAGHEIGCHSLAHADCARIDAFTALDDIARNQTALVKMGQSGRMRSFAYPYGEANSTLKTLLPPRFSCARGILPGLNVGRVDLAHLKANALHGQKGLKRALVALKRAQACKAWLIVFTHDVSDAPSPYGITPATLEQLLSEARRRGFSILPVSKALDQAHVSTP